MIAIRCMRQSFSALLTESSNPCELWKDFTAAVVLGPKTPYSLAAAVGGPGRATGLESRQLIPRRGRPGPRAERLTSPKQSIDPRQTTLGHIRVSYCALT